MECIKFRNYILDHITNSAYITDLLKLMKVSKKLFKIIKNNTRLSNFIYLKTYHKFMHCRNCGKHSIPYNQSTNHSKQCHGCDNWFYENKVRYKNGKEFDGIKSHYQICQYLEKCEECDEWIKSELFNAHNVNECLKIKNRKRICNINFN
jgi:hypothetical protein